MILPLFAKIMVVERKINFCQPLYVGKHPWLRALPKSAIISHRLSFVLTHYPTPL